MDSFSHHSDSSTLQACIRGAQEPLELFLKERRSILARDDNSDLCIAGARPFRLSQEQRCVKVKGHPQLRGSSSDHWGEKRPSDINFKTVLAFFQVIFMLMQKSLRKVLKVHQDLPQGFWDIFGTWIISKKKEMWLKTRVHRLKGDRTFYLRGNNMMMVKYNKISADLSGFLKCNRHLI